MDRDEFNRIKEAEKAHLRKVRALKQQLREAKRKKGLLNALQGLDTSALDATHEDALRKVTEQNLSSEARFEIAMEALDAAEKQEADRAEIARHEAERQQAAAADLVQQMKAQMLGDAAQHVEAQGEAVPPAEAPQKTIGGAREPDDTPAPPASTPDAPNDEPEARSAKSIGRFRPDTERD